jgi:hypothetical protein
VTKDTAQTLLNILALAHEQWEGYQYKGKTEEADAIDRFIKELRCRMALNAPIRRGRQIDQIRSNFIHPL